MSAAAERTSMARKREFDPDELLDVAVQVFWKNGYAETSMRDIVEATGVAHAGIYNAFGSKNDLYFKCLQRYYQRFRDIAFKQLEAEDSDISNIQKFFAVIFREIEEGRFATGCLIGNTVVEFDKDAEEVIGYSREFMNRLSGAFGVALKHAQDKRQVSQNEDIKALAEYLTTFFYGLMTMVRAGMPMGMIRSSIDCALSRLA